MGFTTAGSLLRQWDVAALSSAELPYAPDTLGGAADVRTTSLGDFQSALAAGDWAKASELSRTLTTGEPADLVAASAVTELAQLRDAAAGAVADAIRERISATVADELGTFAGREVTWAAGGPLSGTDFRTWALAPTEPPALEVAPATTVNCWEMILLAAHRAGALPWSRINAIYASQPLSDPLANAKAKHEAWLDFAAASLLPGPVAVHAGSHERASAPARGDVVIWNGRGENRLGHVALALGQRDDYGRHQVYSFWPAISGPAGQRGPEVLAIEDVTTKIERFADIRSLEVSFGPGPWC